MLIWMIDFFFSRLNRLEGIIFYLSFSVKYFLGHWAIELST